MSLVLLSLAALCRSAAPQEQAVQCGHEAGPSPEWTVQHTLTPGDLRDLQVKPVQTRVASEDDPILMNISWILRADASIRLLKATKICVSGKSNVQSYSCVRCNYTEAFRSQTRPSGGKWVFSFVGFPVEPSSLYLIGAHNIPGANMDEDGPSLWVSFTSPGCLSHIMKYKKQCVGAGSLWEPNMTACKKNEGAVEVNFTTALLTGRYMALVIGHGVLLGFSHVLEREGTRTSVVVLVNEESEGAEVQVSDRRTWREGGTLEGCLVCQQEPQIPVLKVEDLRNARIVVHPETPQPSGHSSMLLSCVNRDSLSRAELIPYFSTCGNDCIRRNGTVVLCPETGGPFPPDRSLLGSWLPLLLSLMVAAWVLAAGTFLTWRRGKIKKAAFPPPKPLLPLVKVLVLYPSEICFRHTVCTFTDFLQTHCGSEVILEKWQKKKIAEMGPVQWLTAQKQAADRVVFLLADDVHAGCDRGCGRAEGSQDLFPLAFNLFCSDLSSQARAHRYVVVCLGGAHIKDPYDALRVCPQFHLMKDGAALQAELLHITRREARP